jgi:hypothetical protein
LYSITNSITGVDPGFQVRGGGTLKTFGVFRLADYNLNFDKLDRLPFEKTQNMISKNILGVHNKASNLAIYTELGSYPRFFSFAIRKCK